MYLFCSLSAALSPQVASATESCFSRQHNVSDNNNQCFSGANGHLPSQLAAQRPGAIDNQPLVTTDPMKARTQYGCNKVTARVLYHVHSSAGAYV